MKNRLGVPFVVAAVSGLLALGAAAAPGQAQEPSGTVPGADAPVGWWGHGLFLDGFGHGSFPEPGFGSVRARVDFDDESRRFDVRVDRVGVGCCVDRLAHPVHPAHPGFLLYAAPRREGAEPWWTGLGLFGDGPPGSPLVPPPGRDTLR